MAIQDERNSTPMLATSRAVLPHRSVAGLLIRPPNNRNLTQLVTGENLLV